jgi:hypothetical protein
MDLKTTKWWTLALASALLVQIGCADDTNTEPGSETAVEDPALIPIDVLLDGAPPNSELANEDKADQNFPPVYTDILETQSPVKSQGSRGVCSIFSTAAYMEHLYILEGTKPDLDVSEQYLQWSAKFEVGSFPNTSGSNARANLEAISRFGVPEEEAWPYETTEWNSSNDEACTGEDDQPTRCYTNGEPPESALDAEKFFLPRSRWMSTRPRSIKAQMFNKQQGVVVGLTFFYQAWNHRRSELPTNRDYWNEGYVLYPNEDDERISLEKRAGHSILLIGWDDTLEVPRMDSAGNVITDENGDPVMERGFFLFKNSWGTGSFGKNAPCDGCGYISQRYVEEYGSARVADLPEIEVVPEVCGDGIDNDNNGASDCDDAVCAAEAICQESSIIIDFPVDGGAAIPDNDPEGLVIPVAVTDEGTIDTLALSVNIEHTYRGDISVDLITPSGDSIRVHEPNFESEDNLERTFVVDGVAGQELSGEWQLRIIDHARVDEGSLISASMEVVRQ